MQLSLVDGLLPLGFDLHCAVVLAAPEAQCSLLG
jgi:hypothetical protein